MLHEQTASERPFVRDLGGGLVMSRCTPQDAERVATFHANTLLGPHDTPPIERLYYWLLDMLSGRHPAFDPADFLFVEDTATGKIVSSLGLISQTWAYEGTEFGFGQPEVVSTDPAYRRRGLVRAQMEEVHRWSAERGEMVQGITGIPWYYRQFGYEMALSLDAYYAVYPSSVPMLPAGSAEPYRVRPATLDDLPLFAEMHRKMGERSVISQIRSDALWRFELRGRHEGSGARKSLMVIESSDGRPVGAMAYASNVTGCALEVRLLELRESVPHLSVAPTLLRHLDAAAREATARSGKPYNYIRLDLGENHPLLLTVPSRVQSLGLPYAWYIRVPDIARFVGHIAPALERRLAASPQAGFTGEMLVSFYTSGLKFVFNEGAIAVERWQPEEAEEGDALFPGLTFLQLLFCNRALQELQHSFHDCLVDSDVAQALLPVLFPHKPSRVWAGG